MRASIFLALILISLTSACGPTPSGDPSGDATASTDADGATLTDGAEDTDTNGDAVEQVCVDATDCDGDGILDSLERMTGTDPDNADSDGDSICDGSHSVEGVCTGGEDLNDNGQVDPGESDPREADSDGDGVNDVDETAWLVCNNDIYGSVEAFDAIIAGSVLALPAGFSAPQSFTGARAATFSNPTTGVHGYVIQQTPDASMSIGAAHLSNMVAIGEMNVRRAVLTTRFTSQRAIIDGDVNANNAVASVGAFEYGAGSNNSTPSVKDVVTLRDEIVSAIAGVAVSSGEQGASCAEVTSVHLSELRADGTQISIGAVVCADQVDPTTQKFLDDLMTSTLHAPGGARTFVPRGKNCEQLLATEAAGAVDFLWVVDSSGSMRDEQDALAATAELFLDRLQSSGADWRLAVTTTDAYCLADPTNPFYDGCNAELYQDPLRDTCTGLRGAATGFLDAGDDVERLFAQYVTENAACEDFMFPENAGRNLCGFGLESGLDSAIFVIDQLGLPADARAPGCSAAPEFSLRDGAELIVVWISDEEDQLMKSNPPPGAPLLTDDPVRAQRTEESAADLALNDVTAFAIVGDTGADAGGVCAGINPSTGEGAEYGEGYIDVADATGGASGSICSQDLDPTVDAIMRQALSTSTGYTLDGHPIASSIHVATSSDGIISPIDEGNGYWTYDANTRRITFFGVTLAAGEEIVIAYRSWEQQGS